MLYRPGLPPSCRPRHGHSRGLGKGVWLPFMVAGTLAVASAHAQLPDLRVRIQGPGEALAGTDIGPKLKIEVANTGIRSARGTTAAGDMGYMVDIFLTRTAVPEGFANYSEHYQDGVLLRGGRISNTVSLNPGARHGYSTAGGLPADTPAGSYRLCARVDPGRKVTESNEGNNVACTSLKVTRLHVAPMPHLSVVGEQPAVPAVQRSVLPDGTLQITYPDGSRRQRRPDGKLVTIQPDGTTMVPYALQVQPAELPPLPGGLADWGARISDSLLSILRGLLSESEYQAYLQTEQDKTFYELVDWRLRSIGFLTAVP